LTRLDTKTVTTGTACLERIEFPYSLILSTNKLVVSNKNWYFESVRSNQAVGTSLYDSENQVAGWYFEVIVHSKGIMQIGKYIAFYFIIIARKKQYNIALYF